MCVKKKTFKLPALLSGKVHFFNTEPSKIYDVSTTITSSVCVRKAQLQRLRRGIICSDGVSSDMCNASILGPAVFSVPCFLSAPTFSLTITACVSCVEYAGRACGTFLWRLCLITISAEVSKMSAVARHP